jgi:thiamine biosynthesis lipoprotein
MLRERFRAMGTDVELLLDAQAGRLARAALAAARAEVDRLEALLSRFRPDSELSRLNRRRRMRVGPDLLRLVPAALALRRRTGGRFDPTVGAAVRACGYDASFERLARDDRRPPPPPRPSAGAVVVDRAGGWIALGPGAELDLGAIAKGDAADRACAILAAAGPALVNAGGDLRVSGRRRDGAPWPVAIRAEAGEVSLLLGSGALATSGVDRRRWRRAGRPMHHVVAPRRGLPADTDLVRATAVAPTCAEADALATALLVAGAGEGRRLADRWGVPAALVAADGSLALAGGLR